MVAVAMESSSSILRHSRRHFSHKNAGEWQTLARTSSTMPRKSKGVTMSANYSRVFNTNNPLYETKEGMFDRYLEDTSRVLAAMFPDEEKQQISQNFWRVKMLPVQLLFLRPQPVIEVSVDCKSVGQGYPRHVPKHVTKLLEINMTKCELEGLNFKVTDFQFNGGGVIYPDRRQTLHRLKSRLDININYSLHPMFPFFPEQIVTNIFEKNLVPYMNRNLLRDYDKYRAEHRQSCKDG